MYTTPEPVSEVRTVDVDFEPIDAAIAIRQSAAIAPGGAERYLPFVVRAATITARRYPESLRALSNDGRVSIIVRVVRDGVGYTRRIDDAPDRRIASIATDLQSQSTIQPTAEPASLTIVAIDGSTLGDTFVSSPGDYPVVLTLTGVGDKAVAGKDLTGCTAMSMHSMGSIGLAWSDGVDHQVRDIFIAELKHQLEHREWITELE